LLVGCSANRPVPDAARPTPPADLAASRPLEGLNAVAWSLSSTEHDAVIAQIYRAATDNLPAALADPARDVLPEEERNPQSAELPPAVILDVDETVLDGARYNARLILAGREHNKADFEAWCAEASAPALPGAAEFTRTAARLGVAVFYVTNRGHDLDRWTLENLRRAGLAVEGADRLLARGTDVGDCRPIGDGKGCRRRLVARHHRVVMMVGDQLDDFVDVADRTPAGRAAAAAPYLSWFGDRWWILPNPVYGAWERALFGGESNLSLETRRTRKLEALERD